jgi:hypothetical protein
MLGLGLLDEVDFIVKESGLRCCDGDNGRLTLVCSRWDNRMTVEEKDFYSSSPIYDFGDVALDSFDYIHRIRTNTARTRIEILLAIPILTEAFCVQPRAVRRIVI